MEKHIFRIFFIQIEARVPLRRTMKRMRTQFMRYYEELLPWIAPKIH